MAGLVAITPAAGAVDIVGRRGHRRASPARSAPGPSGWKFRLGYDDSLDVVGVHLVGGVVGTVLIGVFSTSDGAGGVDGLLYGGGAGSLADQSSACWSRSPTAACSPRSSRLLIKFTIGLRISEDDEVGGIDLAAHGEAAYDSHTGVGGGGVLRRRPAHQPSTATQVQEGVTA